ncbi:uncharacterized protein AMSG_06394 [Thecamonas trahens ATCC 50062]|uniref:Uncharacterized protein n=1 Tax=Thecamonas trahens ATCC 50062 TaxID=461836 RepID=A0A0L0DD30_THETB|nr:hypothetical protein AMSG_06394 [Thecamonas trahens ATCC 50062]KNC50239.1 hypothetical protein AMSG_06394 [Thecamonas trahens ATCC 50062]|eukprot:XP_013757069.1 hypothetical protein AMSG_06394 [Thecamonas trahens ATCC 50062]
MDEQSTTGEMRGMDDFNASARRYTSVLMASAAAMGAVHALLQARMRAMAAALGAPRLQAPFSLPYALLVVVLAGAVTGFAVGPARQVVVALAGGRASGAAAALADVVAAEAALASAVAMAGAGALLPFAYVYVEADGCCVRSAGSRGTAGRIYEASAVMVLAAAAALSLAFMAADGATSSEAWLASALRGWTLAGSALLLVALSRGLWMALVESLRALTTALVTLSSRRAPVAPAAARDMEREALLLRAERARAHGDEAAAVVAEAEAAALAAPARLPPSAAAAVWDGALALGHIALVLGTLAVPGLYVAQLSLYLAAPDIDDHTPGYIEAPRPALADSLPAPMTAVAMLYMSWRAWLGCFELPGVRQVLGAGLAPGSAGRDELDHALARGHSRTAVAVFDAAYIKHTVCVAYAAVLLSSASMRVPALLGFVPLPAASSAGEPDVLSAAVTAWIFNLGFLASIVPNGVSLFMRWLRDVWWHTILYGIVDAALINAYALYADASPCPAMTRVAFLYDIIDAVGSAPSRKWKLATAAINTSYYSSTAIDGRRDVC